MEKIFVTAVVLSLTIFSGCAVDVHKPEQKVEQTSKVSDDEKKYLEKIAEADLLMLKGDYKGARVALFNAMAIKRDVPTLYTRLGEVEHRLKNYSEAFRCFDEALKLDPKYSLAYENRGDLNYDLENYEDAINDYTEALRLGVIFLPKTVFERRGDCYYRLNNYEQAIYDYSEVIRQDEYNARAYFKRGMAYLDSGNEEAAFKDIDKAKKLGYFKDK